MNERGGFRYEAVDSFAPKLTVRVPGALAREPHCSTHILVPLSASLYFDPYTARMQRDQRVVDVQHLGLLELEKSEGWSADGVQDTATQKSWWEQSGDAVRAAPVCEDDACERTAVLAELDPGAGNESAEVTFPLHLRYQQALSHRADTPKHTHTLEWSLPTSPDESWMRRISRTTTHAARTLAQAWERAIAPHLTHWTQQNYSPVPLAGPMAHDPVILAVCERAPPPGKWFAADLDDVLPAAYAHLRGDLAAALALPSQQVYVPRMNLAGPDATLQAPVGDATLYPSVVVITLLAVLLATHTTIRSIRWAVAA